MPISSTALSEQIIKIQTHYFNMKDIMKSLMSLTFAKLNMRTHNGNANGSAPEPFFDQLEKCWSTMRTKLIIRNTNPLGRGAAILNFLRSNLNANASRIDLTGVGELDQGNGKTYNLRREYYPRQYSGNLANVPVNYCGVSGGESSDLVDNVSIRFTHSTAPLLIDEARLLCKNETISEYAQKRISEHFRLYQLGLAQKVAALVTSGLNHAGKRYLGAFPGEGIRGTLKEWPILKTDGKINTAGLAWFDEMMMNTENESKPIIVGGHQMSMISKQLEYETCNSCTGVDAAAVNSKIAGMFLRDTEIGTRLGNKNAVLAFMPGALKLVTRNKFKGNFSKSRENHRKTTITMPFVGGEADMIWNLVCGEDGYDKYSIQYETQYDVIGYPDCWDNDPCFKGVTDIYGFVPICSDETLCTLEVSTCGVLPAPNERGDFACVDGLMATCPVPCSASFTALQAKKCFHTFNAAPLDSINAIAINNVEFALSKTYDDLSDADQFTAFVADLTGVLPGSSKIVFAEFVGGLLNIMVELDCSIVTLELRLNETVVAQFAKEEKDVICYTANAYPTTGGVITNIMWTLPGGVVIQGAPGAIIPTPGYYGTVDAFCVDIELAGDENSEVKLLISDNKACTSEYIGINFDCLDGNAPGVEVGGDVCDYAVPVAGTEFNSIEIGGVSYIVGFANIALNEGAIQAQIDVAVAASGATAVSAIFDFAAGMVNVVGSDTVFDSVTLDTIATPFVANCA